VVSPAGVPETPVLLICKTATVAPSALLADLSFVAIVQIDDQFMHLRGPRRGDDGVRRRFRVEARDVLRHRAVEQLHVLWQVAYMMTKVFRRPLVERGSIQSDLAVYGRPNPYQGAGKRGFAGRARADDAKTLPVLQRKPSSLHDEPGVAGGSHADVLDDDALGRHWQFQTSRCSRQNCEQVAQTVPTLACGDIALPMGDREIDWGQRPRRQDRTGDDDACRSVLPDDQIGAEPERPDCRTSRSTFDTDPKPSATSLARCWPAT
jgi:hypothetical protein